MVYDDEKLLTASEYEIMAKAYSQSLKNDGFVFVKVGKVDSDPLISEIYDLLLKIQESLRHIGNFNNLNKMSALNQSQINTFQILYPECSQEKSYKVRGNKNSCFLNMLSMESELTLKLLSLCEQSPFSNQINRLIRQRLYIYGEIFKIKGLIT